MAPVRPKSSPVIVPEAPVRPLGGFQAPEVVPSSVYIPPSRESKNVLAHTNMPAHTKSRLERQAAEDKDFAKPAEKVVCDLCKLYYRKEVEDRYQRGEDPKILAATYGLSVQLIRQHMIHLEASYKLESTIESISGELLLWRDRVHKMYAEAQSMLDILKVGFIKEIDNDGNIILDSLSIRELKPTMDVILKTIAAGQSLAETYAKLHQLYKEEDRSGPVFQLTYVNIDRSVAPVVIDRRGDSDEQIQGSAVRYIAGDKVIESSEVPAPDDMLKIVESYLAGDKVTRQFSGDVEGEDHTRPAEFDTKGPAFGSYERVISAGPAVSEDE